MQCLKCHLLIKNTKSAHYGLHPVCFAKWFGTSASAEFIGLQRKTTARSSDTEILYPENSSFFHGKFKKYTAELEGKSYILKMREKNAPELPEVEYLCNQIAKQLGLPVAEFYFIQFNNDNTFVTKNFINPGHMTDLQHIYHFRTGDQHSCESLIHIISEKTQHPKDVTTFIKTLLFDALIGNHDRHGRNLGFIVSSKNFSLSPIYDNVSYLSLEHGGMLNADFNPTGKIRTKNTDAPSMKDYVSELIKLNYKSECSAFYKSIKLNTIIELINSSFCSTLMKEAFKKLIQKRLKEFEDALSN